MTDTEPAPPATTPRKRKYGGPNGYGHIPDPDGHRRTGAHILIGKIPAASLVAALTLSAAASFSMRDAVMAGPGIMNQLASSSCTGHGTVGAIETTLAHSNRDAQGLPHAAVPHHSPFCVYDIARCIDRTPGTKLTDDGAEPNQVMRGISAWGVCLYSVRPTIVSQVNDEPKLGELEGGRDFLVEGEYELQATGTLLISQAKTLLAAGFTIGFATDVDSAFEDYDGTGAIQPCDPADDLGGHWLYLTGWRTNDAGETEWEFANSWDLIWGDYGFGWGSAAWFQKISNTVVMQITIKKAA